jgi:phage FluMu protein Com
VAIVIHCAHCRRMLQVQEEHLGKTVKCPSCGGAFAARREEETFTPAAMPDFELDNDKPAPQEEPAKPRVPSSDQSTYAVQLDAEALAPPPGKRGRRRPPRTYSTDEDYESDVQPHRGVLILVLGILSIVLACIPLAGWILGGVTMSMASHDERLMEARAMDRSGRAITKAGQACGIIGVFLATVAFIFNAFMLTQSLRH